MIFVSTAPGGPPRRSAKRKARARAPHSPSPASSRGCPLATPVSTAATTCVDHPETNMSTARYTNAAEPQVRPRCYIPDTSSAGAPSRSARRAPPVALHPSRSTRRAPPVALRPSPLWTLRRSVVLRGIPGREPSLSRRALARLASAASATPWRLAPHFRRSRHTTRCVSTLLPRAPRARKCAARLALGRGRSGARAEDLEELAISADLGGRCRSRWGELPTSRRRSLLRPPGRFHLHRGVSCGNGEVRQR